MEKDVYINVESQMDQDEIEEMIKVFSEDDWDSYGSTATQERL